MSVMWGTIIIEQQSNVGSFVLMALFEVRESGEEFVKLYQ